MHASACGQKIEIHSAPAFCRCACAAPQARFYVVTRLRDDHVKRFRGSRRRRSPDDGGVFGGIGAGPPLTPEVMSILPEEPEPEGARAVCMHCRDGGAAEQLMLCDGPGCDNVSCGRG